MTLIQRLIPRLKAFRDDTRGSVTVEFAMMMPLLFWAYCASYVFFDAYRQSTSNLKAAFTVGDMISRETQPITNGYMDSMYEVTRMLTRTNSAMTLRVSVIRWDTEDNRYYLDWSSVRGTAAVLTDGDLVSMAARLPLMPDEQRVILVETFNTWEPPFNVGMTTTVIDNFVFTHPRFAPQVVWQS